jgi:ubiquinone/menaquinone biosynthesis C-methylase UbiE
MAEGYIHGFSSAEQHRLVAQAQNLAPRVFEDLDLSGAQHLLELGCGVGAELAILRERWPHLALAGVDHSGSQLATARRVLAPGRWRPPVALVQSDALQLPFACAAFDRVITIWLLEHVKDPRGVLREALRVTRRGGAVICTEVDNATFGFDPPEPLIEGWWQRFNRYQQAAGGDPYVGAKLEAMARELGCAEVRVRVVPVIDSRADPQRRTLLLDYLRDLLLSGADNLIAHGYADEADKRHLRHAFARVREDLGVAFRYQAVRLTCSRLL